MLLSQSVGGTNAALLTLSPLHPNATGDGNVSGHKSPRDHVCLFCVLSKH